MTYSCTDFTDDVFNELHRTGAIHKAEAADDDLDDNQGLQAHFALLGIARLVEVKKAFEQSRRAVEDMAKRNGVSLQDGVFCEADKRGKKALAAIEQRPD